MDCGAGHRSGRSSAGAVGQQTVMSQERFQTAPPRGHQPDYVLALAVFVLLAFGLVMMYSISPVLSHKMYGSTSRNYFFYGQLVNAAVGLLGWVAASRIHYSRWRSLAPAIMVLAMVAMV